MWNTLKNIEELSRLWGKKRKEKERREMVLYRDVEKSSMNLNGKFWNFWPNFIHLKISFFFSLFSRLSLLNLFLLFMCPFIHHWRNTQHWLCICAILSSLLFHTQISFFFFLLCLSFILIISRILQKNGINYLLYLIHNEV